ncbi:MAG: alanine/glycine:cation symporter family protein [Candidatus Heteroscillospira sp.]|jgi:AGCS family alanine or glycine:cation symporter
MLDAALSVINTFIAIGDYLWGWPILVSLAIVSVLYTIGTRGFQFTHFGYAIKKTFLTQIKAAQKGDSNTAHGVSSFKAMCMALCNTLGTGNIAGIAVAISLGGPGAVLWIWIAGFLGIILKYSEITLGVKYREIDPDTGKYRGGIMWYVEKGLSKRWRWIAILYALVYAGPCINAPAVQINTLASSITAYFDVPPMLIGIICALLLGLVLLGGVNRISIFAEKTVTVMSVAYFAVSMFILIRYLPQIPQAFGMIFKYALTDVQAIAGGFGGATVALAMRHGFARGFYSNGAGTGDSAFAHSYGDVDCPCDQGIWGLGEVVIDTIVCTCTALVILVTGAWESSLSGAALTASAVSIAFGSKTFGNLFIMVVVAFFAFTTALMCAHYSEISLRYFTRNQTVAKIYRLVICLVCLFATNPVFVERVDILWRFGDFNVAMNILLSLLTLFLLRKDVFAETEKFKQSIKNQAH